MIEWIETLKIASARQSNTKPTEEVIIDHFVNVCGKVYPKVLSW